MKNIFQVSKLLDCNPHLLVVCFIKRKAFFQDSQQSVTSVIFQDGNTVISAGAVDGNIKVWDLRKNYSTFRAEPQPYSVFPYPGTRTRKHGEKSGYGNNILIHTNTTFLQIYSI